MNQSDILQSIVVQGTLLESDTNYYVELLGQENVTVEYRDPVEKTVASVFRMCLDGSIDPWNIDLKAFVKIFSDMVDENFRDFGAAGYLIYQAWRILNEKSRNSLERRLVFEEEDGFLEDAGEIEQFFEPIELTVREPVKHQEKRKVFLVELLDAMRDAYKVAPQTKKKEILHVERIDPTIEEIVSEMHAEEPEAEIQRLYELLLSHGVTGIMDELWDTSELSRASFFVYCMFLMREKKIRLAQEVPYGVITIERPE